MKRTAIVAALSLSLFLQASCSERDEVSPLYVLEELETASSVEDPGERIQRLEIFVDGHPESPYRTRAYDGIFDAMAVDLDDYGRALDFLDGVLGRERDPHARGMLHYTHFAHLWKRDRERAVSLAGELAEGQESYYRLFLYLSYYLVWDDEYERYADLARETLSKAIAVAANEAEQRQAAAVLGTLEWKLGGGERALEILEPLAGTYAADETLGEIYWERGEREKALEAYVRLAAAVPGARGEKSIDSLYALAHPGDTRLDDLIWERRMLCCEDLVPRRFIDIEGRAYDLARMRGKRLVINIWQPT